ncbi:MAG: hypothetical protein CL846_00270 [Crocinitomicaceae bacterium]|nr:hypothetical protein [Crocinitomicaceae bacterium]|tara:strand:+ start:505 stop:924 length:420 start_codon:yes stop_codon:yes gene_type:complete
MDNIENQTKDEFKVLGLKIEILSVIYGISLILFGIIISFVSGSNSFTSYIPSIIGTPILIFSYLSIRFVDKRKLFMHIVVLFGLVAFLGGLDLIRGIFSGIVFDNIWADISKAVLLITGLFFTIQCIRSFIHARRNKIS